MSFNIDWDNIVQNGETNLKIKEKLNSYLQEKGSTLLPKYIKNTYIELIDIGNKPPEICLKDITEPLPAIYESLKEDFIEEWCEKHGQDSETVRTKFELEPNNLDSQLILDLKYIGDFQMVMKADLCVNYPSENFIKLPLKLFISDLKIHSLILLAYLKNVTITVKPEKEEKNDKDGAETIKDFEVTSFEDADTETINENPNNDASNKAIFTILCDVKDNNIEQENSTPFLNQIMHNRSSNSTPISTQIPNFGDSNNSSTHINNNQTERIYFMRNISIRTEIGEGINVGSDGSILRNIQDLEVMIVDLLRKFIREEICYPNWLEFDM